MKESSDKTELDEFLIFLGLWIKAKRESEKLTQEQVSEKTGIEYKYYQKIEAGKINITFETFHRICITLGINPKRFFN